MAVERDSSYREHAPADTLELVHQLREMGIDVKEPVWTIGRLDERGPAAAPNQTNGNGNGTHAQPESAADEHR